MHKWDSVPRVITSYSIHYTKLYDLPNHLRLSHGRTTIPSVQSGLQRWFFPLQPMETVGSPRLEDKLTGPESFPIRKADSYIYADSSSIPGNTGKGKGHPAAFSRTCSFSVAMKTGSQPLFFNFSASLIYFFKVQLLFGWLLNGWSRITSYNVCYTKLLRRRIPTGPDNRNKKRSWLLHQLQQAA